MKLIFHILLITFAGVGIDVKEVSQKKTLVDRPTTPDDILNISQEELEGSI